MPVGFHFDTAIQAELNKRHGVNRNAQLGPLSGITVHDGTGHANGELGRFGAFPGETNVAVLVPGTGIANRFIARDGKPFLGGERVHYLANEMPHQAWWKGDHYEIVILLTGGFHPDVVHEIYPEDHVLAGQGNEFYLVFHAYFSRQADLQGRLARYARTEIERILRDTKNPEYNYAALLFAMADNRYDNITADFIRSASDSGNPLAQRLMQSAYEDFEDRTSGPGIARYAREQIAHYRTLPGEADYQAAKALSASVDGNLEKITGSMIGKAAAKGSRLAQRVLIERATEFGRGMAEIYAASANIWPSEIDLNQTKFAVGGHLALNVGVTFGDISILDAVRQGAGEVFQSQGVSFDVNERIRVSTIHEGMREFVGGLPTVEEIARHKELLARSEQRPVARTFAAQGPWGPARSEARAKRHSASEEISVLSVENTHSAWGPVVPASVLLGIGGIHYRIRMTAQTQHEVQSNQYHEQDLDFSIAREIAANHTSGPNEARMNLRVTNPRSGRFTIDHQRSTVNFATLPGNEKEQLDEAVTAWLKGITAWTSTNVRAEARAKNPARQFSAKQIQAGVAQTIRASKTFLSGKTGRQAAIVILTPWGTLHYADSLTTALYHPIKGAALPAAVTFQLQATSLDLRYVSFSRKVLNQKKSSKAVELILNHLPAINQILIKWLAKTKRDSSAIRIGDVLIRPMGVNSNGQPTHLRIELAPSKRIKGLRVQTVSSDSIVRAEARAESDQPEQLAMPEGDSEAAVLVRRLLTSRIGHRLLVRWSDEFGTQYSTGVLHQKTALKDAGNPGEHILIWFEDNHGLITTRSQIKEIADLGTGEYIIPDAASISVPAEKSLSAETVARIIDARNRGQELWVEWADQHGKNFARGTLKEAAGEGRTLNIQFEGNDGVRIDFNSMGIGDVVNLTAGQIVKFRSEAHRVLFRPLGRPPKGPKRGQR